MQDTTQQAVSVALQIAFIVLPILVTSAATWLTRLIGQNVKDKGMRDWALSAVQAAEQKVAIKSNRYTYAADLIHERFPALPARQVEMLIEAAVHALKVASSNYPPVEAKKIDLAPPVVQVHAVDPATIDPATIEREVFKVLASAFTRPGPDGGEIVHPSPLVTETAPAPAEGARA